MADAALLQREMFDLIKARDFTALADLYHPAYTYTGADGTEHKGAEAGVAVAEMYMTAFPDLEFEVVGEYAAGHVGVMELIARGTHEAELEGLAPTGNRVEMHVCNVIEERDGLIIRERDYFDELTLMRQLGVAT